jgi:hypothetical protein
MRKRILSFALLLLLMFSISSCLGPQPAVINFTTTPPAPGSNDPFRVEAVISNSGPGEGQVEVQVNLKNKQNGETIGQETHEIEMQPGETQHVLFEIDLPPSDQNLDAQSIQVDVQAEYPIE